MQQMMKDENYFTWLSLVYEKKSQIKFSLEKDQNQIGLVSMIPENSS